ncbi:SDR family NAD(P)-dependent oxidoreductase [Acinetobacter sp. WZC-1]|uniref:SDR family NAD(P)-dependent oxidoreductase n=1 Tax=Acinetobacter sp. WZC-1 TaxID=3459034 RepID=UPI00403DC3BA
MKTVIITGANTGIGYATAHSFVQAGHHVLLACRNPEKAQQAQQQLQAIGSGKVDTIPLDLNSLAQVSSAADQILQQYDKIDVLVNNAGMMAPRLESTAEGYEKQFGVNYLAHFLWTLKLLPVLKQAEQGRIIHLASIMHLLGNIKAETFRADQVKKYNGILSYANSKLASLLFSNLLARQLQGSSMTSNALHPGGVDSEIYRGLPAHQYKLIKLFLIAPEKPAELIHQMALAPEWATRNGKYVSLQTPAFRSGKARNMQLAQQLYDQSHAFIQDYL